MTTTAARPVLPGPVHDRIEVRLTVKAAGEADGLKPGEFTGYASVFGNIDSYREVVAKGAFTTTLAEWDASGDPIPLLWGHNMFDPESNIGVVVDATEDDHGLLVRCQLDDDIDHPGTRTAKVYQLLKGRRVTRMSFAYDVVNAHQETIDGEDVLVLDELKLYEVSVVPIPANPAAQITAVKATDLAVKEGRTISAATQTQIQTAIDALTTANAALTDLVKAAAGTPQTTAPAGGTPGHQAREATPDTDEAPAPGKSDHAGNARQLRDLELALALTSTPTEHRKDH